jgi:transcription initiation factor TFIIB
MLANELICKTCNKFSNLITDAESGETICTNCGIVINTDKSSQQITRERHAFDAIQSRVGMPLTLTRHDRGLSTVIGSPDKDASGQ